MSLERSSSIGYNFPICIPLVHLSPHMLVIGGPKGCYSNIEELPPTSRRMPEAIGRMIRIWETNLVNCIIGISVQTHLAFEKKV